jgi:hypothetical protein
LGAAAMITMPFGKYRGCFISELPLEYLDWLLDQEFIRNPLRSTLEREFEKRLHSQEPNNAIDISLIDELVSAGLRTLSKKYHPDLGGDHDLMVALNNCAEWLRQQARRIAA